jgi:hypothetical protein
MKMGKLLNFLFGSKSNETPYMAFMFYMVLDKKKKSHATTVHCLDYSLDGVRFIGNELTVYGTKKKNGTEMSHYDMELQIIKVKDNYINPTLFDAGQGDIQYIYIGESSFEGFCYYVYAKI